MSASFVQERVSSATLEVADEDGQGDLGFIIFVEAIPGDNNWNGIHDYCERITVNAVHSEAGLLIHGPRSTFKLC